MYFKYITYYYIRTFNIKLNISGTTVDIINKTYANVSYAVGRSEHLLRTSLNFENEASTSCCYLASITLEQKQTKDDFFFPEKIKLNERK